MSFAPLSPTDPAPFRICFVCSGNICRSPMAEIVMRNIADAAGFGTRVAVSSAGTGDWHVGEPADARTVAALAVAGLDGSRHRAKQFETAWFGDLDLVVALDRSHERILKNWAPSETDRSKVQLLLALDPAARGSHDVPDPYYADPPMFGSVLTTIDSACRALFDQLAPALRRDRTKTHREPRQEA
jgi:Protein-tyrosine-phosphatase